MIDSVIKTIYNTIVETSNRIMNRLTSRLSPRRKKLIKRTAILGAAALIFLSGIFILWVSSWRVPTIDSFAERKVTQSTKIYDRTGKILLYDVFQNIKRTVVPFDEISPNIKNATLAIEDIDFYKHNGIKPLSILRAILVNLSGLSLSQGGSTITQQVVKNSLLSGEKRISRKLKEWVLAIKLERILTKDQIFSMYLNEIPYGGNIYGVEEASNAFFGKKSSGVTMAEAAYLAALPKAPSYFSPYGPNREQLEERKNLVLKEMLRNNFLTQEEYDKATKEKIIFGVKNTGGIKAPHFVMFVKDLLEKKYGSRVLEEGGLKVTTTLDYDLEKNIENVAGPYALQIKKNFEAENIATVAIDPKTGQILAMIGSRDHFDKDIDGNFNVATAHRQPGSSFKPFAYATAFNKGYTPNTALFDVETEFSTECAPDGTPLRAVASCYMPVNYDSKFRGPVTMRQALAQSINIPSIKTLYLAGMSDTLRLAKDMGIESLTNIGQYGLTLVLGGGEVSLLDMTSAYGVFANSGVRNPYKAILEVKDKNGNVLESFTPEPKQVLSENTASLISNVLSDDVARTPAFGAHSVLYFPGRDVAVKTGTTNDYRDVWVIGYTPNIAIGAWAGNNDNHPMQKKIAGTIIVPYWNTIMTSVLKTLPDEKFKPPIIDDGLDLKPVLRGKWQGGVPVLIDKLSQKKATEFTPIETLDERLTGGVHSILYWLDKTNPRGEGQTTPQNDSQFGSWEYGVRKWVVANNFVEPGLELVPQDYDNIHRPELSPKVAITNPIADGSTFGSGVPALYPKNGKVFVTTALSASFPITKIEYFVNGSYIGNSTLSPFTFSFIPEDIDNITEKNSLRVVVYDSVFNKGEATVDFNVAP